MEVFKFSHENSVKASCCNSRTTTTYWIAENREEAEQEIAENTPSDREAHGNCAACFALMLDDGDYAVAGDGETVVKEASQGKEYAIYNKDRRCFLGELGGYTDRETFGSKRQALEFLFRQVREHSHLREAGLHHLEVVSVCPNPDFTETARTVANRYFGKLNEDKPDEAIADEVISDAFDEIEVSNQ